MTEKALDFFGDFLAPGPPPTKEQVQQRQEDAEFRFGLAAWAREQAAKVERQAAEARRTQDAAEREVEDDGGRQRERERDRGYEREM